MQIHEITFGPKKLNEGLLDTVKAAYTGGGIKGVAKAMVSPNAYAQSAQKGNLAQADKLRQQLQKQYKVNIAGSNKGKTPEQLQAQVAADPKVKQAIQSIETEFFTKFFPGVQIKEAGFNKSSFVKPSARVAASGRPPAIPIVKTAASVEKELNDWIATKVTGYSSQLVNNPDIADILSAPLAALSKQIVDQDTSSIKTSFANFIMAAKAAAMYNSMLKQASGPSKPGDISNTGIYDNDYTPASQPTTAQLVAALKKAPRNEVDTLLKTAGLK